MTHVVLIADSRYPICEPFAGGMQSMTWHLVLGLRARGLEVSVFAGPGSDPQLEATRLATRRVELSAAARNDVSMEPVEWIEQHHAYLRLMLALGRRDDIDLVHNNSLHHLPIAMAELLTVPVVTTLHTPPTPWLEPVVQSSDHERNRYVAVSGHTARQWGHVADATIVLNGADTTLWPEGPGGDDLVWFGRMVPEKAPHLAIDIAERTGRRLLLAGPVADPDYWSSAVEPRLGDRVRYLGHLRQAELATVVGSSAVCLVTPMWDEPYGLVAAEALSCGTPVVGFAKGGLPEVGDDTCVRLVAPGDVAAAAAAVEEAARLARADARRRAVESCSVTAMVDAYVELYASVLEDSAA
jgi:glycosyltransferase involved in cell wall biosynthesis